MQLLVRQRIKYPLQAELLAHTRRGPVDRVEWCILGRLRLLANRSARGTGANSKGVRHAAEHLSVNLRTYCYKQYYSIHININSAHP